MSFNGNYLDPHLVSPLVLLLRDRDGLGFYGLRIFLDREPQAGFVTAVKYQTWLSLSI